MSDGSAPWIKVITRIFEDPKIIAIEQLPEGSGLLIIWFKLLTLAGEQNRGGAIYFTDTVPFTAELLAAKWRCKTALVQMALAMFQKFGMIGIDAEGTVWILNWSKYQNEEGLARIRDRSLMQLEDRSVERSAHVRELAAVRQRRHREKHKQNGAVTRNALRSVTVTPVTLQTKIKTKNKEIPPTVPPRGTDRDDLTSTKEWLNKVFGRKRVWSYEEDQLLASLLPIAREDRALLSWAYTLRRDSEGWALIDGERASKPKQGLLMLLREFSSEIDKWRSVRANGNSDEEDRDESGNYDQWTQPRLDAAKELFPQRESFPGQFGSMSAAERKQIDARVENGVL
jgi:predicted phage replisome organizer